jgi:aconitate hydratase
MTNGGGAGPEPVSVDSFGARTSLSVGGEAVTYFDLHALERAGVTQISRLPFTIRILLENLLRHEDGRTVTADDIRAVAGWSASGGEEREISFRPARVLLQDFTGVPAVVDLAAMRDAMAELGGVPGRINPLLPSELVIDHSVQVDSFGRPVSFQINAEKEFERNRERYAFLRWGQWAFGNFRVVPPDTGIVHQVNLEYLARVVFGPADGSGQMAYPDTLVGTDSHTTMINGLGVLGWGVGGIEAEAAMLGQPISLLVPEVVGFRLRGRLTNGATATDLVLRVTEMLREKGVVGKFVEFFGHGFDTLSLADRATLGNMAPEYGATCAFSPIDPETLAYLRFTARPERRVALVEAYARAQGLFHDPDGEEPEYSDTLDLDMGTVEPSLAGPRLPQERIPLSGAGEAFERVLEGLAPEPRDGDGDPVSDWQWEGGDGDPPGVGTATRRGVEVELDTDSGPASFVLRDGAVVIAAITSCTNTSNPSVMVAAGLLARNAARRGLKRHPWVKTSLAPGSKVVTEYLEEAGLMRPLEDLGFNLVGYGCTTCIGNSGPLEPAISQAVRENGLVVCSVLSGNRNFEGRINPDTRANYLASPPLVVAYSLAGRMDLDLTRDPLGEDGEGRPVYLADIWPSQQEIRDTIRTAVRSDMFSESYSDVFAGSESWRRLEVPEGDRFAWDPDSTYVRQPPFFVGLAPEPPAPADLPGLRALAVLGDSVTTDHISPAGAIAKDSPAADYLRDHGVSLAEFNSYGSRRGNHEVMMRGTFANIRLRNQMVPGVEGGWTEHVPSGDRMTIFGAAERYREEGVPLLVLAGEQYGTGSSRDWAAKGPALLGVRVVIAKSYERIHRSNLIGMGVLPLQFLEGEGAGELGLDGTELFAVRGIDGGLEPGATLAVQAQRDAGDPIEFSARVRLDTRVEVDYWRHGGILQMVLRRLASE